MQELQDKLIRSLRTQAQRVGVTLPETAMTSDNSEIDQSPLAVARQKGLDEASIARSIAEAAGIQYVQDLADRPASASFVEKVPIAFARQHVLLGLAGENGRMLVAVARWDDLEPLEIVARWLNKPVVPVLAPVAAIQAAINAAYQHRGEQAQAMIARLDAKDMAEEIAALHQREDLLDVATRAPVIKLVNLILFEAVRQEASDVHVQPYEDRLIVRLRIDGMLFNAYELPKALQEEVLSRVKVMGGMNIAEKRLPQDGRATVAVGDRIIDLRIASLPGAFGERLVIRLLDKSSKLLSLQQLGMNATTLERFRSLITVEHGLILVTGPTGSGKTTTLYAALQEINSTARNVITLEDPIEYQLPGVSQTQINTKKGMTFASGLRSVLRQDPDIIMVGEVRDQETAAMAIQSALTGHLVFSTLHTNDAASAVTRLLDLGIEAYLAASSLVGVLAQRLVRRVCPNCGQTCIPMPQEFERLDFGISDHEAAHLRRGVGCERCRNTGYRGRVGVFELLAVDESVRRCVQQRATAAEIQAAALEHGMQSMRDDGLAKILAGVTTAEEVLRVTMRSS
ncbi:MAG: Flp pilus assembly complex ATPase component TadA [Phycisphaeraceae bacterium]|nr:Flp pilus assembly complex ATPase component TadA [Phycisphaeraceae bacterium]